MELAVGPQELYRPQLGLSEVVQPRDYLTERLEQLEARIRRVDALSIAIIPIACQGALVLNAMFAEMVPELTRKSKELLRAMYPSIPPELSTYSLQEQTIH